MIKISVIMTIKIVFVKNVNVEDIIASSMSSNQTSQKIQFIVKVFIIKNLYLI